MSSSPSPRASNSEVSSKPRPPLRLPALQAYRVHEWVLEWSVAFCVATLGATSLWVLTHWLGTQVGVGDMGVIVNGAERVSRGEVPYRDFFTLFTPGSYYLLALAFDLWGATMAVVNWSVIVTGALLLISTYALARDVAGRASAAVVSLLWLWYGYTWWLVPSHHWYGALAVNLGSLAMLRYVRAPAIPAAATAGLAGGVAFIFLNTVGLAYLAGMVIATLLWATSTRAPPPRTHILAMASAAVVPIGLMAAGLAYAGALLEAAYYLGPWTLANYRAVNDTAYLAWSGTPLALGVDEPRKVLMILARFVISWLLPMVSGIVALLALRSGRQERQGREGLGFGGGLTQQGWERGTDPAWWEQPLMLSILSLAGFTTLFSRPDQNHLGFLSAPMWALVACLWERSRGSLRPPLSHLLHVRAVSTVCGIALLLIAVPFSELVVVARGETRAVPTPRGELPIGVHADENFVRIAPEVLAIIVGSTSPSDPIFVYPAFPLYYFLSGRHNATSYDFLYHTAGELQHVISQLERSPPSLVVLDRKNPRLADPNVGDAGSRGGRALLLGKIEANYRMRLERSGIEVWVRRPG